jgi:hypothetical protein
LNSQTKRVLQSAPITIRFAGFESDTLTLQNNGWQLALEDEFDHMLYRHRMRFILKHDMLNLYCLSNIEEIDYHSIYNMNDMFEISKKVHIFQIQVIARDVVLKGLQPINMDCVNQIDAMPEIVEIQQLSLLPIFKTIVQPDNALIVEPDKISALLEQIVACQSPKQAEIRERMKKSEGRENFKQTLHAQILSVAA